MKWYILFASFWLFFFLACHSLELKDSITNKKKDANVSSEKIIVRFLNPSKKIVEKYRTREYDVAAFVPGEYLDILLPLNEYIYLKNKGYNVYIHATKQTIKNNLSGTKE